MEYFAVIDTETNWQDQVMSIGVVIADEKYELVDEIYMVFDPEVKVDGMYSNVLYYGNIKQGEVICTRKDGMDKIHSLLSKYRVQKIFAYNATFDKNHLKELISYCWFDIMRIAAYKQHNDKIGDEIECCKTGKMKREYGVEPMTRMLSGNKRYREVHNAVFDARDELNIMRLLGKSLEYYQVAKI